MSLKLGFSIPPASTSAISSSKEDVSTSAISSSKKMYFLNTDTNILFRVNLAVIVLSKVCLFYSLNSFLCDITWISCDGLHVWL